VRWRDAESVEGERKGEPDSWWSSWPPKAEEGKRTTLQSRSGGAHRGLSHPGVTTSANDHLTWNTYSRHPFKMSLLLMHSDKSLIEGRKMGAKARPRFGLLPTLWDWSLSFFGSPYEAPLSSLPLQLVVLLAGCLQPKTNAPSASTPTLFVVHRPVLPLGCETVALHRLYRLIPSPVHQVWIDHPLTHSISLLSLAFSS
jgi:hypothetical protein